MIFYRQFSPKMADTSVEKWCIKLFVRLWIYSGRVNNSELSTFWVQSVVDGIRLQEFHFGFRTLLFSFWTKQQGTIRFQCFTSNEFLPVDFLSLYLCIYSDFQCCNIVKEFFRKNHEIVENSQFYQLLFSTRICTFQCSRQWKWKIGSRRFAEDPSR